MGPRHCVLGILILALLVRAIPAQGQPCGPPPKPTEICGKLVLEEYIACANAAHLPQSCSACDILYLRRVGFCLNTLRNFGGDPGTCGKLMMVPVPACILYSPTVGECRNAYFERVRKCRSERLDPKTKLPDPERLMELLRNR